jgi:hypothetical protein
MLNFFWEKKKSGEPIIKRLIQHASDKNIKVTFEIGKTGSVYQILTNKEKAYGYERGNEGLRYYISQVRDKLEINFDESSSYVFARVTNNGDNCDHLFSDMSGKIYHVDLDNGRNPKVKLVAKNFTELTGDFRIKDIKGANYHFKFCRPIFRIAEFLNYNRVVEIQIQGFLIEHYEHLFRDLFEKNPAALKLDHFEYQKIDWNDSAATRYPVKLKINGAEFMIKIEKSGWFDFNLPNQINPILKELNAEHTIQILHEDDWDEKHALCLLNKEEYDTLDSHRVIVEL